MNRNCNTCIHTDVKFEEYPCCVCKRTAEEDTSEYKYRADLWSDGTSDSVNHPSHYNKGKIEVADFISDQKLNFARGNAVKYVCRAGSKDPEKEIQDLEKAIWYINHEIKILKGDIENGTEKET